MLLSKAVLGNNCKQDNETGHVNSCLNACSFTYIHNQNLFIRSLTDRFHFPWPKSRPPNSLARPFRTLLYIKILDVWECYWERETEEEWKSSVKHNQPLIALAAVTGGRKWLRALVEMTYLLIAARQRSVSGSKKYWAAPLAEIKYTPQQRGALVWQGFYSCRPPCHTSFTLSTYS